MSDARKRRSESIKPFKKKAMKKIIAAIENWNPICAIHHIDFSEEMNELLGTSHPEEHLKREQDLVLQEHIRPELTKAGIFLHCQKATSITLTMYQQGNRPFDDIVEYQTELSERKTKRSNKQN